MERYGYNSLHSWIALMSCTIISFFSFLFIYLSGLFFVIFIDEFGANRTNASIPIVVFGFLRSFVGSFVALVGGKIGYRAVITIGCVLGAIGLGTNFFARRMIEVIVFFGLFHGLGVAFVNTSIPTVLRQHFDKNLDFVFGFCYAGSTLAGLTMTPTVQYLKETYGARGMCLILSGLYLHSIPAALLLKHPHNERINSNHMKECDTNASKNGNAKYEEQGTNGHSDYAFIPDEKISNPNKVKSTNPVNFQYRYGHGENKYSEKLSDTFEKNERCELQRFQTYSDFNSLCDEEKFKEKQQSQSVHLQLTNFNQTLNSQEKISNIQIDQTKSLENNKGEESTLMVSINKSTNHILELFTDPTFICIMMMGSIYFFILTLLSAVYIDLARDKAIPDSKSMYFVMFTPIATMFSMISFGWITDKGFMTRVNFVCMCFVISFFTFGFIFWSPTFETMMVAILANALVMSSIRNTLPGVVFEFIAEDKQSMAIASRFVPYAFLCLLKSPLIGYVRETTGTYAWIFYILMSCALICSFLSQLVKFSADFKKKKYEGYHILENVA